MSIMNDNDYIYLDEAKDNKNLYGNIFEGILGKVTLDDKTKTFKISKMNFKKFLIRLREMYKSRGLSNLFDKRYSAWSTFMWEKEKISKDKMKIVELSVPLFFALEIYSLFLDIGEFYKLPWYNNVAKGIYKKTWISNYETREQVITNTSALSKLNFKPKDYQLEFIKQYETLKHIYDLEGYILSFDQGLGKTFTAIGLAECLGKDQIVIVCPNSLKENWAYEIRSYFKIYSLNEEHWKKSVYVHGVEKLQNYTRQTKYIIVNQESIPKIYDLLKPNKNSMIIVDESHNFRNNDGKRTKELLALKEILNCKDNLLMSGTPIKATPDELIPALRMIDPYFTADLASKYEKAFSSDSVEISRIVKNRFSRTIYRRTKDEVLKLPEKHIRELYVKVTNEEEFYLSTLQNLIAEEFSKVYKEKLTHLKAYQSEFNGLVEKYSSASPKETKDYLDFINCRVDPTKNDIIIHERREEIYKKFLETYVFPNIKNDKDKERLKFLLTQYVYMVNSARGIALGKILPKARTKCFIEMWKQNRQQFLNIIDECPKKTIIFTLFSSVSSILYFFV